MQKVKYSVFSFVRGEIHSQNILFCFCIFSFIVVLLTFMSLSSSFGGFKWHPGAIHWAASAREDKLWSCLGESSPINTFSHKHSHTLLKTANTLHCTKATERSVTGRESAGEGEKDGACSEGLQTYLAGKLQMRGRLAGWERLILTYF